MKSSCYIRNSQISKFTSVFRSGVPIFAYKRDVVVVIKMVVYIHGMLSLCGCLVCVA